VNGPAYGAGFDITCACDIRIAGGSAAFAENFVKVGIISGDGGSWLLPRAVGLSRAAEMTFTGDPVDASTALAWGLVPRSCLMRISLRRQ
jgi:enoyl-CoA hydratase/carnithine racemase